MMAIILAKVSLLYQPGSPDERQTNPLMLTKALALCAGFTYVQTHEEKPDGQQTRG